MSKKTSKTEAVNRIENFFSSIKDKTPKEVKKVKNLAMSFNIPLKEKRRTFCKNCLSPYVNSKVRIRRGIKSVTCEKCGFVSRWKIR